MKKMHSVRAGLVIFAFLLASFTIDQTGLGPHGGQIRQAENYKIEALNSTGGFQAYLFDEKMNAIENKGISSEVRFIFSDKTSADFELKPFGQEGFQTDTKIKDYQSCRVYFHLAKKSISAKFENESMIVNKK